MQIRSLVFTLLLLAGCKGLGDTTTNNFYNGGIPTAPQTPASVSQIYTGAYKDSIKVGDTTSFMARVVPTWEDPTFIRKVTWRSADTTVLSVVSTSDSTARATARKAGSVQVRAYSVDTTKFVTLTIRVYAAPTSSQYVVALIAYSGPSGYDTLKVGAIKTPPMPRVDINLANGSQRTLAANELSQYVLFSSTNPLVASVDVATGVVTARAVGQAQIFACAKTQVGYCAYYPQVFVVKP